MRTITAITVARSDYGIYRPVFRQIMRTPGLRLRILVAGMHLAPEFGLTIREIEADGFPIADRIDMLLASDTPEGQAKSMGLGILGFSQAYARERPDLLLALGDRAEMHAAVLAALPFTIPVAHLHGGEISEGAIDDALRHSMTKLSHLHFVATEEYAQRVRQLGEEPWRITVSGAPSLDNLAEIPELSKQELEHRIGLRFPQSPLLVTYHPVSLEYKQTGEQIDELIAALKTISRPIIITKPNADVGGRLIMERWEMLLAERSDVRLVDNLGTNIYFNLMRIAAAMVGNSSSGLIEAPSFALPVVNIGTRQNGRTRAANVIDCGYSREEIRIALQKGLSSEFRTALQNMQNPFGTGQAGQIIAKRLSEVDLDNRLIRKQFYSFQWQRDEQCKPAA